MVASPPGPVLQKLNALLHQEYVEDIVYCLYWATFLLFWTPIAVIYLQIVTFGSLLFKYVLGRNHRQYCHPSRHENYELAVVITGCDSGIGKELALWAADAGFIVFAACLEKESMRDLELLPNMIPLVMNVTSDKDVEEAIETVSHWLAGKPETDSEPLESKNRKRFLHALINNAGVGFGGEIDWMDLSCFQKCIDVNYMGMVRCCKGFLPLLKEQAIKGTYRSARIFNLVSMAGMVSGGTGLAAYHASKHAAYAFSSCLRIELEAFHIQVTTVNPSFHLTPIVTSMYDECNKVWKGLTEKTRMEYGQAFFERWVKLAVDRPLSIAWKMEVLVDQMMRHLVARTCPPEVLIGTDARFVCPIIRMIPAWVYDVGRKLEFRPVPAAMKR